MIPTPTPPNAAPRARVTRAGMARGARVLVPVLPAVALFGLAAGAAAASKGLTAVEFALMNALVYAGMAQMVALESWPDAWTPAALVATVAVTLVVNARLMLMSAGLRPLLERLRPAAVYPLLFLLTDATYVVAERERAAAEAAPAEQAPDLGPFVGACAVMWLAWVAAGALGHAGGALVGEPRRYGLDLVAPAMFTVLGVPILRRAPRLAPFAVAGFVALAADRLGGGHAALLAGAVAGVLLAAFRED